MQRIVIVDGYFTGGGELLKELLERNVECVHLQSTSELPAAAAQAFEPAAYDASLGYLGEADAAAEVLSKLKPDAVVAASEWGAGFADQVAHALGLPSNRPETTPMRLGKHYMIEAARRKGLHVPDQAVVITHKEAQAWTRRLGSWPVVIKPTRSAWGDGVSVCYNEADVELAFARAQRRRNRAGGVNDPVLVQSFLSGRQFLVNTVSVGGQHFITDAWQVALSSSAGAAIVPQEMNLLSPLLPNAPLLFHYVREVLTVLGVENCAAHTKIKWTTHGPALIETAVGLMRVAMDRASYCAAGLRTQAAVYAAALANPPSECDPLQRRGQYSLGKHMTKVFFTFDEPGEIASVKGLARLRTLRSFHAHYRPLSIGERVPKTVDTLPRGGVVYLVHESRDQITSDLETIREWERGGELYDINTDDDLDTFLQQGLLARLA
jgi:hypothetical protein